MPSYKYVIELSDADCAVLNDIVSKGTSSARTILRANMLLASDKTSVPLIVKRDWMQQSAERSVKRRR